MKALLDEVIPVAVAIALRRRRLDVVAVAERAELRSRPDADILEIAHAEQRVVVTRDRVDYLELDRQRRHLGRSHSGLVLVSSRFATRDIGSLVRAIGEVLSQPAPYPGFVHWL